MTKSLQSIRVTDIGEFIRHQSCDRRFKLNLNNMEAARSALPFFDRLFNPLDLVLQESGRKRENQWEDELTQAGFVSLTPPQNVKNSSPSQARNASEWTDFVSRVHNLESKKRAYGRSIRISADFGAFHLQGDIDFVLVLWDRSGNPRLRIVECKASRRDRTYHRVQVALYHRMLCDIIKDDPLAIQGRTLKSEDIDCVVARIDENTNNIQSILGLSPIDQADLVLLEEDIARLLAKDGRLRSIVTSDLDTLEYQINDKCGTCIFNVYCLPEAGIRHSLELLGTDPSIVRDLRKAGVSDIDRLSELDLESAQAHEIRSKQGFSKSLEVLKVKALTRKSTLPGVNASRSIYKVQPLPFSGHGQLPEHTLDGRRLIRVYLSVDYDYVENRLGALAAHITNSTGKIYTAFVKTAEGWRPDPCVKEAWQKDNDNSGYNTQALDNRRSKQVVRYKISPWTGRYDEDTNSEREIIEDFLHLLIDAIKAVAPTNQASIHFYVWSRSEMSHLVEACTRASTVLLGHLNELLGCREGLDQLIFSCLEEEVDTHYALGWTGRGLTVAASLSWFGWRFHWFRNIDGSDVDLERTFTQDLFDFKTTLAIKRLSPQPTDSSYAIYGWARTEDEADEHHRFEIRSRFFDSLPAPYWHAVWGTLPKPEEKRDSRVANAIRRYNQASRPDYLQAYLTARTQALRWIEERMRWKNRDISKPVINLNKIKQFSLGVTNVSQAAVDFLRLDAHVHVRDWTAEHLIPPAYRISSGHTIPIKNVYSKWNPDTKNQELVASINLEDFDIDPAAFTANCSIGERDFVRVTPCSGNRTEGQRLGQLRNEGSTCVVRSIEWSAKSVVLAIIPSRSDRYKLRSESHHDEGLKFDYATIDESPSNFVAQRVENALLNNQKAPINQWLDPLNPAIPPKIKLKPKERANYKKLLKARVLPNGYSMRYEQREACLDGLDTRIQLLHGPPGTGKTITTATATLVHILARLKVGDVVLLAANTHTAVNILLQDIADLLKGSFEECAVSNGYSMPPILLAKTVSSKDSSGLSGDISVIDSKYATRLREMVSTSVAVIGGTVSSILKLWENRGGRLADLQAALLVIDEASMMVFPHFLALATLLDPVSGQILLAGDHQQLPPIVAHDWLNEDRPPVVLYQPFTSAYVAIQNIGREKLDNSKVCQSPLRYSFRLPPEIRELINRLYGQERALHGRPSGSHSWPVASQNVWESVWHGETGLYLIIHDEKRSKLSNNVEAYIVEQILSRCGARSPKSVAIITPHRAQRGLLTARLTQYAGPSGIISSINTVESFQGGQQDTIIVSASESDPSAISTSTKFILDLKRSNVAFSRAKERLIVICAETLLDFIPPEADDYEATLLWRSLRQICSREIATEHTEIEGDPYELKIFTYNPNWGR